MADNQQQVQPMQPEDWGDTGFTPLKPGAQAANQPVQIQQQVAPTPTPAVKAPQAPSAGESWGDTPFTPITKQGQANFLQRKEQEQRTNVPVEPSAAKRYMSGLYATTLGPMAGIGRELMEKNGDIISQAAADYRAGNHLRAFSKLAALAAPISPENPEIAVSSQVVQGAIKSMNDEWSKGIELGHQGRYSEAAGHLLASVIPFMGPAAAHAGERMGEGDIAGGLGEATGLVSTVVSPRAAVETAARVAPTVARAAAQLTPGGISEALERAAEPRAAARAAEAVEAKPAVAGKIIQETDPKQLAATTRALGIIDTAGVKTYSDLADKLDTKIRENVAKVDTALTPISDTFKPVDVERTIPVEGGTPRVVNPVQDALAQMRDFYEKTNDDAEAARVEGIQNKFASAGLSVKEINDIAREHASELSGFNPQTGELASGLGRQAAENTRSGVKDVVHRFTDDSTRALDAQTSDLITARNLSKDMAQQVLKLEQKFQEAGWGQRLARFVKKTGPGMAGGLIAGPLLGMGHVGGAITGGILNMVIENMLDKTGNLNAVKLQARLPKLLGEFRRLNTLSPEKALRELPKVIQGPSPETPEPPKGPGTPTPGGGGAAPVASAAEEEPEIEIVEPKGVTPGGSGESAASQEAINRLRAEAGRGVKRFRVDTRSGNRVPLIGVDAIDAKPGPYDRIIMRDAEGNEVTLDRGQKAA